MCAYYFLNSQLIFIVVHFNIYIHRLGILTKLVWTTSWFDFRYRPIIMQALGKFFVFIFVTCYLLTVDAKSNTVKDKVVDGSTDLKDTVSEGVKVAAETAKEYAEVFTEKAASAAETGNEYLAQGADIVKEYAT